MSDPLIDNEQGEFIQAFVEEGREMLDEVEPLLIELEQEADPSSGVDPEVLNTIFRLFHSLKGAAGFLDFDTVSAVTHEAETVLDIIRKGDALLKSEHIDLFNRAADFIRELLDGIERNFNDKGHEDKAGAIISELKDTINTLRGNPAGTADEKPKTERKQGKPKSGKNNKAPKNDPKTETKPSPEKITPKTDNSEDLNFSISAETVKTFISECEELLESAEQALLTLEKEPGDPDLVSKAFRALHSIKGNAGFLGYADIEEISHHAETLLDNLKQCGGKGKSNDITLILNTLDFIRDAVSSLAEGKEPQIPGKSGILGLLEEAIDKFADGREDDSVRAEEVSYSEAGVEDEVPEQDEKQSDENFIETKTYTGPDRRSGGDRRNDADTRTGGRRSTDKPAAARQTIRVDIEKLDIMMDLVGELVISEAMVSQNPDLRDLDISLDRFEKSVLQLNKITRDLQDIATSVRMIPLSGTFRKMMRLVRDLAQKVSKKVELEIIGEETEVDKTVIEQINDPLVHIIRNSVDHGLESPADRKKLGKPEAGKIVLEAKYVGGEVWIIIKDDGKGLNRERILARAIERELIDGDGSDLQDEEIWQMIFQPGFSTAEKITDVSGRGVGMDVVKRNIEKIRGKVEVRSETGVGTSVILRIPLTLAIIDGMIVRVGSTRYTIPIVSIKESLQPDRNLVCKMMDGQEIVNIRNQLIPVVRLYEFFHTDSEKKELAEGILVIVENEGRSVCLFLDEVIGQQQVVIKGLSDYVGSVHSVSGCTILGDGTISLILDIKALIERAENKLISNENRRLTLNSKPTGVEVGETEDKTEKEELVAK